MHADANSGTGSCERLRQACWLYRHRHPFRAGVERAGINCKEDGWTLFSLGLQSVSFRHLPFWMPTIANDSICSKHECKRKKNWKWRRGSASNEIRQQKLLGHATLTLIEFRDYACACICVLRNHKCPVQKPQTSRLPNNIHIHWIAMEFRVMFACIFLKFFHQKFFTRKGSQAWVEIVWWKNLCELWI